MAIEFKGFEKIGMDTSALIYLSISDVNLGEFIEHFCYPNRIFYHAAKVHHEIIGILINKFYFNKIEAIKAWENVACLLDLNIIYWHKKFKEDISLKVKQINQQLIFESGNPKLKIGDSDISIISCFLNEEVMSAYTFDKGFGETCRKLGIKPLNLPKEYITRGLAVKRNLQKISENS